MEFSTILMVSIIPFVIILILIIGIVIWKCRLFEKVMNGELPASVLNDPPVHVHQYGPGLTPPPGSIYDPYTNSYVIKDKPIHQPYNHHANIHANHLDNIHNIHEQHHRNIHNIHAQHHRNIHDMSSGFGWH